MDEIEEYDTVYLIEAGYSKMAPEVTISLTRGTPVTVDPTSSSKRSKTVAVVRSPGMYTQELRILNPGQIPAQFRSYLR